MRILISIEKQPQPCAQPARGCFALDASLYHAVRAVYCRHSRHLIWLESMHVFVGRVLFCGALERNEDLMNQTPSLNATSPSQSGAHDQIQDVDVVHSNLRACRRRLSTVALCLLFFGADTCKLQQIDDDGKTALGYAEEGGEAMRAIVDVIIQIKRFHSGP